MVSLYTAFTGVESREKFYICRSAGDGENEGSRCGVGPLSDVRESRHSRSKGVQLPRPSHPSHPAFTDHRARSDAGVRPDTDSAGLLQRCVAWSSSRQYSEIAACAEYCSTNCSSGAAETVSRSTTTDSCTGFRSISELATRLVLTYKVRSTSTLIYLSHEIVTDKRRLEITERTTYRFGHEGRTVQLAIPAPRPLQTHRKCELYNSFILIDGCFLQHGLGFH